MAGAFFFVVFVVVAIFIILHVVNKTKRRVAEWSLAAQSLGLDYVAAGFPFQTGSIHGECQGVWISVALHSESSGRSSKTYTRYTVQYADRLPLDLRLTRQGYFHGVASFFGVQDIEVGDPEFDDLVNIKGEDEGAVREFLTEGRRQKIAELDAEFERVSIDSDTIVALAYGAAETHQTLIGSAELLIDAARVLAGAGPVSATAEPTPVQRVHPVDDAEPEEDDLISEVLKSWAEGKSILGAPLMGVGSGRHEVFEPHQHPEPTWESERATDPGIGVEPVEIEAREEAGESGEIHESESEIAQEDVLSPTPELASVDEPELDQRSAPPDAAAAFVGLSDTESAFTELETAGADAATAIEGEPVPSVNHAADSSVSEMCESLFGDDASGYEIDERFAPHQGQRVAWSGVLREASGFDLDFELGSGTGTRAVFEVHQVTSALGTSDPITAVVRFPEGYEERLAKLVGERVTFEGRLEKVKGLMKELILLDGELSGRESEER